MKGFADTMLVAVADSLLVAIVHAFNQLAKIHVRCLLVELSLGDWSGAVRGARAIERSLTNLVKEPASLDKLEHSESFGLGCEDLVHFTSGW